MYQGWNEGGPLVYQFYLYPHKPKVNRYAKKGTTTGVPPGGSMLPRKF